MLPCDILLTHSSDPKGVCYVETKSLDGETNLKMKPVHKELINHYKNEDEKSIEKDPTIACKINSESPNNAIYKFEGVMETNNSRFSLSADNMLLRGSTLRNTEYVFGITIFTGHETKVM